MKENISIVTTVINFELYDKTSKLFPLGIQKFVIDGRNEMHGLSSILYMFEKLKGKGIKWLVMADEDVVFTDPEQVFSIINQMEQKNYQVCGVRDGGIISHRMENPFAINTFFSILDFSFVESIWNKREVRKNQYINKNEFTDDLTALSGKYNEMSTYEPYYCFYFWLLRRSAKFMYLNAKMADDGISNSVEFNGKPFLYHTWYARSYGNNAQHTERINVALNQFNVAGNNDTRPIIFKDATFAMRKKIEVLAERITARFQIIVGRNIPR